MKPQQIKMKLTQAAQEITKQLATFTYAKQPAKKEIEMYLAQRVKHIVEDKEWLDYYDYGFQTFQKKHKEALVRYPEYKEFLEQESQRLAMQKANVSTVKKFVDSTDNKRTKQFLISELIESQQIEKLKLFDLNINHAIPVLYTDNQVVLDYLVSLPSINLDQLLITAVIGQTRYARYLVDNGASVLRIDQPLDSRYDSIKAYETSINRKNKLECTLDNKPEGKTVKI